MPVKLSAATVKSAVPSIRMGSRNSPMGTQKKTNKSGKVMALATRRPSTSGTANTSMATKASWVTELTTTRSPASQPAASKAMGSSIQGCGRGAMVANHSR